MDHINEVTHIESVRLSDDGTCVVIIDQTQLPNRTEYLELSSAEDIWESIHLKCAELRQSAFALHTVSTVLRCRSERQTTTDFSVNSGRRRRIWILPDLRL